MLIGSNPLNEIYILLVPYISQFGIFQVCYRPENILLVGIMPGPCKASLNINSFLGSLVNELQKAWNKGFCVISSHQVPITIRLTLSFVSYDIPASRKVSGFCFIQRR